MNMLVTGAAGFIGSAFVRQAIAQNHKVVIFDKLTYAGHKENIQELIDYNQCEFIQDDISNQTAVIELLKKHQIDVLINFAAESHVDNSISGPKAFIDTNITGTFHLLEAARAHFRSHKSDAKCEYLQVSTDEVFGALGDTGKFAETTSYNPNSPYSASKAAADHLTRAWHHTYGLKTIVTNCSNNYGPRQFPEKLIPRMITCALKEQPLPVYGKGQNVRDWIHVEDHSAGVLLAIQNGLPGETYCFGGNAERSNITVVEEICTTLDQIVARSNGRSYRELIQFVTDRAGHDFRYAIDSTKAERELGFKRRHADFSQGLRATVEWYLSNPGWVETVLKKGRDA